MKSLLEIGILQTLIFRIPDMRRVYHFPIMNMNVFSRADLRESMVFYDFFTADIQFLILFVCLLDLILYVHSTISYAGRFFLGLTSTKLG